MPIPSIIRDGQQKSRNSIVVNFMVVTDMLHFFLWLGWSYLNISLSKYGVILSHNSINTFMVDTVLTYIPLSYMDNESHSICFILL